MGLVDVPAPVPGTREPSRCRSPVDGADGFLDAFDTLAQAMRRARGAAPYDRDLLTISQIALLAPLATAEVARVCDLAGAAAISPSTATRILDALERREIIRRARSKEDRRGVTVTLTELGRAVLERQEAWVRARERAFFHRLGPGERELVSGLLVDLAALVDELAAGPAG
ncbi:MAG: MarR family winged helix-turn-helix transcriptional regulator [Solirubrobacteraceae bacterium]